MDQSEKKNTSNNVIKVSPERNSGGGYYLSSNFALRSDYYVDNQIIPLHRLEAFASIVSQIVEEREIEDYISVDSVPPADGAIYVKGDSMYPLLWNGDIVLYKVSKSRRGGLFFGNIYVVAYIEDGEEHIVIKYLEESQTHGYYTLRSHNKNYAPREILRDSVRIIALVKASIRHY